MLGAVFPGVFLLPWPAGCRVQRPLEQPLPLGIPSHALGGTLWHTLCVRVCVCMWCAMGEPGFEVLELRGSGAH